MSLKTPLPVQKKILLSLHYVCMCFCVFFFLCVCIVVVVVAVVVVLLYPLSTCVHACV